MYKDGNRNIAVLEIGSNSVKYALGSSKVDDGEEVIIYHTNEVPLPKQAILKNNIIKNKEEVIRAIKKASTIYDEQLRNKVDQEQVVLIIPPRGVKCHNTKKSTTTCDDVNKLISYQDVKNVNGMVQNSVYNASSKSGTGNNIVDIIPSSYELDNGKTYKKPPLGKKSGSLKVNAVIYTVEGNIINEYKSLVEAAGLRVYKTCVENYCASLAISHDTNPRIEYKEIDMGGYFLIDIGDKNTTISYIVSKKVLCSQTISRGGNDLTEYISKNLYISLEEAEHLKTKYGFVNRQTKYKYPIIIANTSNQKISFYQENLNNVILEFMSSFNKEINVAIESILRGYANLLEKHKRKSKEGKQEGYSAKSNEYNNLYFKNIPVVLIGGGSNLRGMTSLIKEGIGQRQCIKYIPNVIGARNPSYTNLLGAIVVGSTALVDDEKEKEEQSIGSGLSRSLKR